MKLFLRFALSCPQILSQGQFSLYFWATVEELAYEQSVHLMKCFWGIAMETAHHQMGILFMEVFIQRQGVD